MPSLSHDQIKAEIAAGNIFAITIDTAVFDAKQKSFQNAVLQKLDQFIQREIRVVITDVVANEMKAHLREEALETQRALKKALRAHTHRWRREEGEGEAEQLLISSDAGAFAESEFNAFLKDINGEILAASEAPNAVELILARYFSEEPPFGSADKRKSEFPDAFALLRLEAFAKEEGKLLLCVAPDKGWIEFAEKSDHLVCIDRLEDALALFNEADQHVAAEIVQKWRESEGGDFIEDIANAFEYRLDDLDFAINGDADVPFEAEPLSAALQFVSPQAIGEPKVIAADAETVTFTVRVDASVGFEALFSFYVMDSVDKDHVDLGSEEAYVEKSMPFDLTITADRAIDEGIFFHEVEVAKKWFEVDFGYVEAFPNEDPTHEKY